MISVLLAVLLASLPVGASPTATPAAAPEQRPTPAATPTSINLLRTNSTDAGVPRGQNLSDVAKKIKLRLPPGQKDRRLTNESVQELAKGVQLTTAKAQRTPPRGTAPLPLGQDAAGREEERRLFWSGLYQEALGYVKWLEKRVPELDSEVNRLRTAFYSTDDPARRDGVIKPAWDNAIKDLDKTKLELESSRGLPNQVINASRQDNSLPGWFRGLGEPAPNPSRPVIPGQGRATPEPQGEEGSRPQGEGPGQ